jgi:hypothetical protein
MFDNRYFLLDVWLVVLSIILFKVITNAFLTMVPIACVGILLIVMKYVKVRYERLLYLRFYRSQAIMQAYEENLPLAHFQTDYDEITK